MLTDIKNNVHENVVTEQFNFGQDMDFRGHSRGTVREWHQFPGDMYLEADGSYRFTINTLVDLATPKLSMQLGTVKTEADAVTEIVTKQTATIDELVEIVKKQTATIDELTETVKKQQQTIDDLKIDLKKGIINIQDRLEFKGRVDIDNLYIGGYEAYGWFNGLSSRISSLEDRSK